MSPAGKTPRRTPVARRPRRKPQRSDAEEVVQALAAASLDAIVTIDATGAIETFSEAAERMFGYAARDVLGRNVTILMPEPYRSEHDRYLERYLRTSQPHVIGTTRETMGRRRDGTLFPIAISVSEIDHQQRFAGTIRDLTREQALQRRLAEVREAERREMARDLHDVLGGTLTGIGMLAANLQKQLVQDRLPLAAEAEGIVDRLRMAQSQVREFARGLQPVEAVPEGLVQALERLAQESSATSGVRCRVECDPPVEIDDVNLATQLFHIVQEAVNNALAHARASEIVMEVARDGDALRLRVRDDGIGFDPATAARARGLGLSGMRQRCRELGGELTVMPGFEGGTVVTCVTQQSPGPAR